MWPDPVETDRLLEDAKSGRADAVNELLSSHREALKRLIAARVDRALQRRLDASDIVQDVLLVAARRFEEYSKHSAIPFPLWLRQIAQDRVIDAHRRHRKAARRSLDRERPLVAPAQLDRSSLDLAAELRDRELTPAAAATWRELQRRFHEAIEKLDPQDQEVVLMRHDEQLTNQEVARSLGLSEPAAGMRYLRAIRRLRVYLAEVPSRDR